MEKSEKMTAKERKRGILLTIFLTITAFGVALSLFSLNPTVLELAYEEVPWWAYPYTIFGIIIAISIFIGVLKWRKWGIYLFILSSIVAIVMQLLVLPNYVRSLTWMGAFPTAIISSFWLWLFYRRWSDFD